MCVCVCVCVCEGFLLKTRSMNVVYKCLKISFDAPVVDNCLAWKIAQTANASAMQNRSDEPNLYRWVLYRLSYTPLPPKVNTYTIRHPLLK